jgi:glycerol-3-phosphate dehydrogenase
MDVAVIGAGVNGICCAIALAEKGCKVTVYERNTPFSETSSKSSKLLHGGIRYLETFHFKLVREALEDRAWWIKNAEQHTRINRFFIPIYKNNSRNRLKLYLGVKVYEWLAGQYSLGRSQYHSTKETLEHNPALSPEGLLGAVSYIDVQMDDRNLSEWLIRRAESLGVMIRNGTPVRRIETDGSVELINGEEVRHIKIVNACGPWVKELSDRSSINSAYSLALVKGSHLVVDRLLTNPIVVQVPSDGRIVFAIPLGSNTLIGTTEVTHKISDQISCSDHELSYLINAVNSVLNRKISPIEVKQSYSGVRPIVSAKTSLDDLSKATRDSAIETIGNLTNVFGGKWTSAMRLGQKVSDQILKTKETQLC